jgi:hypothetical protein
VFGRLGAAVRVSGGEIPQDGGLPDAHPTYRAVVTALQSDPGTAPLLADASLLDRAAYELGLFSRLLRGAMAGEPSSGPASSEPAETGFATAPSVRLVHTRWDWDGFVADATLAAPLERGAAWMLHLPPSGPLHVRRLHPLPALLLEAGAYPFTRAAAAAAVAERVDDDPARIAALVESQVNELCAAGLLRPSAPTAADHAVSEMRRLLLPDEAPSSGARTIVGLLSRTVHHMREHAEEALRAAGGAYPVHRLDVSVGRLDQLLISARLRSAFAAELDGYWAGADVPARVAALSPLIDVLRRALGGGVHAFHPYLISP